MAADFAARVALVTGAAQGMGRATAELLAARGARVALCDLRREPLEQLARRWGDRAVALPLDVTDGPAVRGAVDRLVQAFGRVDILINAAGILHSTRFEQIGEDEWRRTIDVNLTGLFLCTQAAARPMRAAGYGRVVSLSSTAGKSVSTLGGAHYTASKAGVLGFTRAAAKELARHGITVNAVCPGLIDTEMIRANTTADRLRAYAESFPIQRLGTAEEVAEMILYLASEAAGYVTGASFDITGGDLMI